MDRYLKGEELTESYAPVVPDVYIEPTMIGEEELEEVERVRPPMLPVEARRFNVTEVELTLSVEDATKEAGRCMRCDLEFTRCRDREDDISAIGKAES